MVQLTAVQASWLGKCSQASSGRPLVAQIDLSFMFFHVSSAGSIAYICEPLGSVVSGWISEPLGRKHAMLVVNIPHLIAWLLLYYSTTLWEIFLANILLGLGVGLMEAPIITYVGEIWWVFGLNKHQRIYSFYLHMLLGLFPTQSTVNSWNADCDGRHSGHTWPLSCVPLGQFDSVAKRSADLLHRANCHVDRYLFCKHYSIISIHVWKCSCKILIHSRKLVVHLKCTWFLRVQLYFHTGLNLKQTNDTDSTHLNI